MPITTTIDQRMDRLRQELERHLNVTGLFINTRVARAGRSAVPPSAAFEELVCEELPVHIPAPEPKKSRKIILDKG